ncbi:MAG: hypothetical protein K2J87_01185, partial [Muribaculaceae bacterium]|nr:hypothetical protein [Muribaculaceae bacterium]
SAPIIHIPSIESIDFLNPEEANRYALLLCLATREATRLIPDGNLSAISTIRRAAKTWIAEIDSRIDTYPPSEALKTANSYDFIHRLAYNAPPIPAIIDRQVFRALDEEIKRSNKQGKEGTRSERIDPYLLFRLIDNGIKRNDPKYFGRPLKWQSLKLTSWYKEIKATPLASSYNSDLSNNFHLSDKIEKLALLLQSDLTAYEGHNQTAFKRHLFLTHRHLLNLIPSENSLISNIYNNSYLSKRIELLLSLQHLLFACSPHLPENEYAQKKSIITTIIKGALSQPNREVPVAGASELPHKRPVVKEHVAGASELPQPLLFREICLP